MGRSRITGLLLALMGTMALLSRMGQPRLAALHGSDVVALIGSGMCFGVAVVALLGRLRIRNE
jgi:hypothetical protein